MWLLWPSCTTWRNNASATIWATPMTSNGEKVGWGGVWAKGKGHCQLAGGPLRDPNSFSIFLSLTVHPDMVTIATGQVAGTSKDGKVRGGGGGGAWQLYHIQVKAPKKAKVVELEGVCGILRAV